MIAHTNELYEVLVVEDNPGDFLLVEEMIAEQMIAVVSQAPTFGRARELINAGNVYNVVLLDITLPDHAGEPLIREMVELCRDTSVIVLTGYSDFAFGIRSLAMGIADYLLKDELTGTALYKSMAYSAERKKVILALESSEMRVRSFASQLNSVLEDERSRIAREIHDEFGQQLTGLKMSLTALKRTKKDMAAQEIIIDGLLAEVNTSIASVRKIANELRPALLDKLGLFPALEWLVTEFSKKTGLKAACHFSVEPPEIDKSTQINIFRICQEALNNTAKHAQATEIIMRLEEKNNNWQLTIIDNGCGFLTNKAGNALSMGVLNMQERAHLIGANLTIESNSPAGTNITLTWNNNAN
ncbi:histidine kinase [Mucilaginibacter calamicampi]|uniref:Histidine kinase n=1 Tax=Mucilaginibacter calamicampi TaxID=1302352 RepID=A0ABW2YV13_9SPHI